MCVGGGGGGRGSGCVRFMFCDVVKTVYQFHCIETILDIHVLYVIMTAFYSDSNIVYSFKVS